MLVHVRAPLALGIALLTGGIACGGGGDGGPPAPGLKTVLVVNNEFQPSTVNITAGDTVVWAWQTAPQSVDHNILSTGAPTFTGLGSPGNFFDAPQSHQVVFAAAGTYEYYCSNHGTTGGPGGNTGMAGKVVVAP